MTAEFFIFYLLFASIACFIFIVGTWIFENLESRRVYKNKFKELKDFSESNDQYYSTKSIVKNQHIESFRDPKFMDFYINLDRYFVETDLDLLIKHREYYLEKRPKDIALHSLMDKLIIMKEKEIDFQGTLNRLSNESEDVQ